MARTVDILRYVLGLDARPFRKEASKVDKTVTKLTGAVTKTTSVFSKFAKVVGAVAAALGAVKLGGMLKDATLVAARIEVLKNVFELTGKAAGKTSAELEFNTQSLVALGIAEKEALQIGLRFIQVQLNLADSIKVANAARDLAVISGQNTSQTAVAITDAIVKQRPILLKQFGIIANLDEIYKDLADSLGKTSSELNQSERRQAFLNIILEKSKTVAGSYEKAMELVGKRLTSLPRLLQNAQKAVGQHFLPAMRVAIDSTSDFLNIITKAFSSGIDNIVKQTAKLPRSLEVLDTAIKPVKALREEFLQLATKAERSAKENERLAEVIEELERIFPTLALSVNATNEELVKSVDIVDLLIKGLENTRDSKLAEVLASAGEEFQTAAQRAIFLRDQIEFLEKVVRGHTTATQEQRQAWADSANTFDESAALLGKLGDIRLGPTFESLQTVREQLAEFRKELGSAEADKKTGLEKELDRLARALAAVVKFDPSVLERIRKDNLALAVAIDEVLEAEKRLAAQRARTKRILGFGPVDQPPAPPRIKIVVDEEVFADSLRKTLLDGIKRHPEIFEEASKFINSKLFPKFDIDFEAFGVTPEAIARADKMAEFNRRQEAHAKRSARSRKRQASDEEKALDTAKRREKIHERLVKLMKEMGLLPKTFSENMADATKVLDLAALGVGKINQEMGSLISSAADFTAALATGDIFAKIGASIGLLGGLFGAVGSGGIGVRIISNERDEELIRQQKELVESNREVGNAIDRWIASINEQTLGTTSEQLRLLESLRDIISRAGLTTGGGLVPGGFEIGTGLTFIEFVNEFNRIVSLLKELGIELPARFENAGRIFESGTPGSLIAAPQLLKDFLRFINNLTGVAGIPKAQLEAALSAETLATMLDVLKDMQTNGQLSLASGEELINFWKSFQDLSLGQEKELLEALLAQLRESGDVTPSGILDLLAEIKALEDSIASQPTIPLDPDLFLPATTADTLEKMLTILSEMNASGALNLQNGQELLSFWTGFQDLTLEQQRQLVHELLTLLTDNGQIQDDSFLGLIAQFESLSDAIQAAADAIKDPPLSLAGASINPQTLKDMLRELQNIDEAGELTRENGIQLIDFWTKFQDLTISQQQELFQNLLDRLGQNGNIDEAGYLALLLQIEALGDQIEAQQAAEEASGLTQIQRSVTTITEAQANIISATLNSILGVLGLMDDKLANMIRIFSGIEPSGLLGNGGRSPLTAPPVFALELPGVLASLRGIEESLGSFLDRVAAQTGPLISVSPGGVVINQNFPGVRSTKAIENVTAKAITEALISEGRAKGIQV